MSRVARSEWAETGLFTDGASSATVPLTTATTVVAIVVAAKATRWVETDSLGVIETASELGRIVWTRKLALFADRSVVGAVEVVDRVPQLWTKACKFLHDRAVAELLDEAVLALNGGVRNLEDLLRLVTSPSLADTSMEEGDDQLWADEVDKGIADVAVVGEVGTQVGEVEVATAGTVKHLLETLRVEAIGNVADHQGSADVLTILDLLNVDALRLT